MMTQASKLDPWAPQMDFEVSPSGGTNAHLLALRVFTQIWLWLHEFSTADCGLRLRTWVMEFTTSALEMPSKYREGKDFCAQLLLIPMGSLRRWHLRLN